jgi:hypothetical protein
MLKAKFFIKTKNIPKAIDILNEAIFLYEDYKSHLEEKKNDLKNIYTIETFHQKFKYFYNLFNYLFCMNKLDAKIKKLYFELKASLFSLKFYSQSYSTILELYQKYPDDILIQYEVAKDSFMFSKIDKFQEILEEKKNDLKNIYTIETFHQKFKYFYNLFNYLFCMNKLDAKIKKLYFELKTNLFSLKFYSQSYKTILELYQKYPDDILIQYEVAKDSVIFSKIDKFQEILEEMKKNRDSQQDENKVRIYNNFIMYAEALSELAQCKYNETQDIFKEIQKNEDNPILENNIAVLDIYKNDIKEGFDKLMIIHHEKKNDSENEFTKNTIKTIMDKFNIKK